MNSDDPEARSVAHEKLGKEAEKDGPDFLVLMIRRRRGLADGGGRRRRRRKRDISLHHVGVEYLTRRGSGN